MKSGKEENAEGATDEQEWQKSRGNQETCQGIVKAWYEGALRRREESSKASSPW